MIPLYSYILSCIGSLLILSHGGLVSSHQFPLLETQAREPHVQLRPFYQDDHASVIVGSRGTITSHFRIPPAGHLGPLFARTNLNVGMPTLAGVLPQTGPICPKCEREFWRVIISRTLISTPPEQVAIADLLRYSQDYHQHVVSVQGVVTQPELHLDESELFLDFVFLLSHGKQTLVVYGRHDRTRGAPVISMHRSVEVVGIFRKEHIRKGETISNTLEAVSVAPYPPTVPNHT